MMCRKRKKEDNLDTETTFADMNVEGFRWYNPEKKSGKKQRQKVSKKEYWDMVKGAFAAYAPMFIIIILVFLLMYGIAYLIVT